MFLPSLMQLDDGEVDHIPRVSLPGPNVLLHTFLSERSADAALVSRKVVRRRVTHGAPTKIDESSPICRRSGSRLQTSRRPSLARNLQSTLRVERGVFVQRYRRSQEVSSSWRERSREFKASPLEKIGRQRNQRRKRATACAQVSMGVVLMVTSLMSPDGSRKRHFRAKNCENLAARRNYKLRSGRSSSSCGDAEIDGVWSQSRTIAFCKRVQHHHCSQFLAAVMDRWSSFSRFCSRTLPSYHRCWTAWRKHTPARTRRATPLELCNKLKNEGSSAVR